MKRVSKRFGTDAALGALMLCAGTAVLAGNTQPVLQRQPVQAPVAPNWDGVYAGGTIGYSFGFADRFGVSATGIGSGDVGNLKTDGPSAGLRVGWRDSIRFATGRQYVYGVEFGYEFADIKDTTSGTIQAFDVDGSSKVEDMIGLRFKGGVTNRSGRTLYFSYLGYVNSKVKTGITASSGATQLSSEVDDRRSGYALGIGVEHKLNEKWSLTGEYEYVRLNAKTVDLGQGATTKSTPRFHGLRVGANFRF